jgi:lysyl-tRNA synthetase class 2
MPIPDLNDQIQARLDKLGKLRDLGVEPFPYKFDRTHTSEVLMADKAELLAADEGQGALVRFAGRVVRYNRKGKMCFMHLKDQWGRLQVVCANGEVSAEDYEVVKLTDLGDWIGVEGRVFETHTGEYSIRALKYTFLSKSVRPLPTPKEVVDPTTGEKKVFDAFHNVELRYRQRWNDLTLNDQSREVFRKRVKIIQSIRNYLNDRDYMEIETPVLQPIYGGANARPFTTHHNAAGIPLYMRISPELYLKRALIGGFEKVYEFSRNFRNEGMDKTHNPEFTLLEFYEAYADYNDMMVHFETIYEQACIAANGSTKVNFQGTEIDFKTPWPRITIYDAIKKYAGLDVKALSDDEIKAELAKIHVKLDGEWSRGRSILQLFEHYGEPNLIQPTFVIDFPKESTPLCKRHRTDPDLVEQFEPYCNAWEIGNAYSELNDPVRQREALEEQVERGRAGEDETHPLDENFLNSIEAGMPPTGGIGIGIDRMVMLLTDSPTIRDVILFPLMKPEKTGSEGQDSED